MRTCQHLMLLLAATVLMSSCATRKPYVPTTGSSQAKLFVRSDEISPGTHLVELFDDARHCVGPKTVLLSTQVPSDVATTVPADRDSSLRYTSTVNRSQCAVIFSFRPQPEHKYYVVPTRDGANCGLKIFDVSSGERLSEASARKRSITPIASGGFCTADGASQTSEPRKASLDDLRDLLPKNGGKSQ